MAKKKINESSLKPHDIVFFKIKEDEQAKKIEIFSFEKVDQEDKIKLATDYRPFGNHFQYTIFIDNQSLAPITEVKIKIKFPEFFVFSRFYPPTINIHTIKTQQNISQINVELNELNEKSNKQIHFHFTPDSLDKTGELRTIVTYVNNKDTVRVLDSRPTEITLDNIIIEPKVVPSSYLRQFSEIPEIKKVKKSMGIGFKYKKDPEILFEILELIFFTRNFQMVSKDLDKKILWYFGTEAIIKEDVLVIGQILSNKIEIIAISPNHYLLISLLTLINNDLKKQLVSKGIIDTKDEIYNLECKNCGAILPYFPQKREPVQCKNCNYEQIIW
ncbi:MAG: hypothetical protein ACFE9C_12670 [Candidatus Hodarchaeota archaeon]